MQPLKPERPIRFRGVATENLIASGETTRLTSEAPEGLFPSGPVRLTRAILGRIYLLPGRSEQQLRFQYSRCAARRAVFAAIYCDEWVDSIGNIKKLS